MGITLRTPEFYLPEIQDADPLKVLSAKAKTAAETFGQPCLVDDSGLLLDAYPGFPGAWTAAVCKSLGGQGLARLLDGTTARAKLVCHLGLWLHGELRHWHGEMTGVLDPRRPVGDGPGPLTQWFVPDEPNGDGVFAHRGRALEALERDLVEIRAALEPCGCAIASDAGLRNAACVFCQEFSGAAASIYHELLGSELPSRVVHTTESFLVFPPLGQFVEGGLLLTTRDHWISMAFLPARCYAELEHLMDETCAVLRARYGCHPVLFEHAPLAAGDKGTCCVDHAHLNVFPVPVDVHDHLKKFPHVRISSMEELAAPRFRDQAYLFLQANDGRRFVYEAGIVPSQYIRKIIATELGMPERWHWREYLGLDELKRTFAALAGWRGPHGLAK